MDFLKKVLGGEDGFGSTTKVELDRSLDRVFDRAIVDGEKLASLIVAQSKEFRDNPKAKVGFFDACLYMFVVLWIIHSKIHIGVEKTNELRGPRNEVNRLWSLIRTAFSSYNEKKQMANMAKFDERWEGGHYDEWK